MKEKLLSYQSEEDVSRYNNQKEKIRLSGYPGSGRLIKDLTRLESSENQQGYLEKLVEFNVAGILMSSGEQFQYEPANFARIDFVFGDTLLEIKSANRKGFEEEEQELMEKRGKRIGGQSMKKARIKYQNGKLDSVVELKRFDYSAGGGSSERVESGSVLKSDMAYQGKILEYAADFQKKLEGIKDIEKHKKIMLFFKQPRCDASIDIYIEDVYRWYFGITPYPDNTTFKYFQGMFRTSRGKALKKNQSISAFALLDVPGNLLIWPDDMVEEGLKVWPKTYKDQLFG